MKKYILRMLLALGLVSTAAYAIDVNGELKRALLEKLNADPTGYAGRIYYNTVSNVAKFYNGTTWLTIADNGASLTNPMTTAGDIIYGGVGGAATRLAAGTANQVLHSGSTPSWSGVASADVTGQILVPKGGTGLASGTSGGVPYFDSTTSMASSGALTASRIVLGGGAGAAPTSLAFGTANQILGMNSGATAYEHKTVATGTSGTDFAVANTANTITLNLPDASTTARGAVTTGTQTFGGSKKFSSSGGEVVTSETTGTATSAAVVIQAGNGTTSSRNAFVEMTSLETSPQDWAVGMQGAKDWQLKNVTSTTTPITVKTDGKIGLGPGSTSPGGGIDVWGPTGGLQILFSENSEKRGGITRTNANGLYIYPNVDDGTDYPTTIWRDGGSQKNTIFRANGDVSVMNGELELAGDGGSAVGSIFSSYFGSANGNAFNIKTLNSAGSANTTRIAITGRVNTATIDMTGDVTVSDVMYLGGSVTGAIAQWYGTSGSSQTCNTTCASEPGNVDTDSGNCQQGWNSTGTVTGCATAATNNRCWCIGVRN